MQRLPGETMQRLQAESFEDYKKRIKAQKKEEKDYLRGKLYWDSKEWGSVKSKKIAFKNKFLNNVSRETPN